ncbi:unnamed protein product (macronuclear) [Paramecium tetraurelia]|uniref:Uncharacterized protein n=1 Tax=Paramecium tetraurelia TaxID=5888 RepID=A0CJ74_PARTE|nr:uncharacterized protein GSPATT00038623001 [Paramecium tetraurelia]CAK70841.1 unnamed protein product [Paramecium tetraurelia]|eukprot:XP_001438238.1 hypothetical protein (macronuclear) [Paramecium tetraurelia strain d4-2]
MQKQQQQQQKESFIATSDEKNHILQRLIFILKNKERKPKDQFQQKNFQDEVHFDTILDGIDKDSHISKISSDTCLSYIEIKISDYEALLLKSLLENLQREVKEAQSQLSIYEKNGKGQSDLQNQQVSYVIEQKRNVKSDVIKPNIPEDSEEDIIFQDQIPNKKSQKFINKQQILESLKNMRNTYNKRLQDLKDTKQTNNSFAKIKKLKDKTPKFIMNQQENHKDLIKLLEFRQIINEIQSMFQQYDQEIEGII